MRADEKQQVEYQASRREQTARAVRRQIAALAILGLLVLAFSLWRAGWRNVFVRGWWRW